MEGEKDNQNNFFSALFSVPLFFSRYFSCLLFSWLASLQGLFAFYLLMRCLLSFSVTLLACPFWVLLTNSRIYVKKLGMCIWQFCRRGLRVFAPSSYQCSYSHWDVVLQQFSAFGGPDSWRLQHGTCALAALFTKYQYTIWIWYYSSTICCAPLCQVPMNARNYVQIRQIIQTYDPGSVYFKISGFEPRLRIFGFISFPRLTSLSRFTFFFPASSNSWNNYEQAAHPPGIPLVQYVSSSKRFMSAQGSSEGWLCITWWLCNRILL